MGRGLLAIETVAGRRGGASAVQLGNGIHLSGDDIRFGRATMGTGLVCPVQHPSWESLGDIWVMASLAHSLHDEQF